MIEESVFCLITPVQFITFKNLISTCSLNCVEFHYIGHAHFRLLFFLFFFFIYEMSKTYFFEFLPGHLTDLHKTSDTARWQVCILFPLSDSEDKTV